MPRNIKPKKENDGLVKNHLEKSEINCKINDYQWLTQYLVKKGVTYIEPLQGCSDNKILLLQLENLTENPDKDKIVKDLNHAWANKVYRNKKKKKSYNFANYEIKKETRSTLKKLAKKVNKSLSETLEIIINRHYNKSISEIIETRISLRFNGKVRRLERKIKALEKDNQKLKLKLAPPFEEIQQKKESPAEEAIKLSKKLKITQKELQKTRTGIDKQWKLICEYQTRLDGYGVLTEPLEERQKQEIENKYQSKTRNYHTIMAFEQLPK